MWTMADVSDDVRVVYRTFGHNTLPYHEVAEQLRYQQVQEFWPLLRLIREGAATATATAVTVVDGEEFGA